jgi:multidrug efflux system membrane fusion protein
VNLAYTTITSPIDGVVGLRQVDPGNIVHASDANGLIVITQIKPIAVIFTIPEDQLPQVVKLYHSGVKLVTEAWDRSNSTKIATGALLTIDNQIDQTTGTVKLKAVFDNGDFSLFPNQFVNIRLILKQQPNALVIPSAAIQTGTQGTYVYQIHAGPVPAALRQANAPAGGAAPAAGTAAPAGNAAGGNASGGAGGRGAGGSGGRGGRGGGGGQGGQGGQPYYVTVQPVQISVTEGSEVILAGGLNVGDQVVIDGQEKLKNGSSVSISKANSAAATAAGGNGGGAGAAGGADSTSTGGTTDGSSGHVGAQGPGAPGNGPNGQGHGRGQNGPGQAGQAGATGDQGGKHKRNSQTDNTNGSNGGGQGPTQ